MNLPNDVSRCVGRLDWNDPDKVCPYRKTCARHTQMERDSIAGLEHYRGMSVITNCLVDGEYTARIEK